MLSDGSKCVGILSQIDNDAAHHNQGCNGITDLRDEFSQPFQLFIKRCLDAIVYLCRHKDLAVFCVVTHGKDTHHPIPFHDFRSSHGMVGREGSFGILFLCNNAFPADRLSC